MRIAPFFLAVTIALSWTGIQAQTNPQATIKLNRVFDVVQTFYVDTVNVDALVETAIIEVLMELDPHSIYISKDEVKEMNEPLEGNFEGIGVQFNIMDDTILVVNPIPGGPSEKLGIRAGDRIVKIDGEIVAGIGIKNNDVFKRLRGKKGTLVKLSVTRKGSKEDIDFTITRDKIPIYSLDAAYMIDEKIGYIKLNRFSATTITEFSEALEKLRKMGMQDLILDLQGNGGGYLNAAIDLADMFLPDKKLLLYTEGINSPRTDYKSTDNGIWEEGRLIVMVDEGSASASEIVSGAVQDWDRGIIIGRRTFGKGLVQRPFNLPDGSMIRLTVARYYTPTGRLIQKPYEDGFSDYSKDIINRYNSGELTNADSIHFPDSLKYSTLVKKRDVYGGGGIMPDFFVPLDTTLYTDYYREVMRKGLIYKYVLTYVDNNRDVLTGKYKDFSKFKNEFFIDDVMVDSLCALATREGIKLNKEEAEKSKPEFKVIMKALIARDFWNTSEYFEIVNPSRPEYMKAVEVMKDKKQYLLKLSKA